MDRVSQAGSGGDFARRDEGRVALPRVAIVGATGLVGREILAILEQRRFPLGSLRLFASPRSVGQRVPVGGGFIEVERCEALRGDQVDLALLATPAAASRALAGDLCSGGAVVVDCSSAFRAELDVPLVVPEVNGALLDRSPAPRLVASPNCSTTIAVLAVDPIRRLGGLRRMAVCTYQAASGAGAAAVAELARQAQEWSAGRGIVPGHFKSPYLFNLFSHDSPVGPDGFNEEERKLLWESRRLWGDEHLLVSATCVRVPTMRAHAEAINLTLERPQSIEALRAAISAAPGLALVDDAAAGRFPEPALAEGRDEVLVGRLRADPSQPPGLGWWLFVVGDQLRKGAALNAVQIAERLVRQGRPRDPLLRSPMATPVAVG